MRFAVGHPRSPTKAGLAGLVRLRMAISDHRACEDAVEYALKQEGDVRPEGHLPHLGLEAMLELRFEDGALTVPLDPVDGELDAGVQTEHGRALPFDCFNFDRRPGEVFRRL